MSRIFKLAVPFLVALLLFVPSVSRAQTTSQAALLAQIQVLIQQIAALQAQLNAQSGTTVTVPNVSVPSLGGGVLSVVPSTGNAPLTVQVSAPAALGGYNINYGDGAASSCAYYPTYTQGASSCDLSGSYTYDNPGIYPIQIHKIPPFTGQPISGALVGTVTVAVTKNGVATDAKASCVLLTRTLSLNSADQDTNGEVTKLQTYLNGQGYYTGGSTGYFDGNTQSAVQAWQQRNGVVTSGSPSTTGFGSVGPTTRARMAKGCNYVDPGQPQWTSPLGETGKFDQPTFTSSSNHPTVTGTATGATHIAIGIKGEDGGTATVVNGKWSVSILSSLSPGTYLLQLTDADNNIFLANATLVVTTSAPGITVTKVSGTDVSVSYANIPSGIYAEIGIINVKTGMSIANVDLRQGGTGSQVIHLDPTTVPTGLYYAKVSGGTLKDVTSAQFNLIGTAPVCSVTVSGTTLYWTSTGATSAHSNITFIETENTNAADLVVPTSGSRPIHVLHDAHYSFWFSGPGGQSGCTSPIVTTANNASDTTTKTAAFDQASLQATSTTPTVTGTASGVSNITLAIDINGARSVGGTSSVVNGKWAVTIKQYLTNLGTYPVYLFDNSTGPQLAAAKLNINVPPVDTSSHATITSSFSQGFNPVITGTVTGPAADHGITVVLLYSSYYGDMSYNTLEGQLGKDGIYMTSLTRTQILSGNWTAPFQYQNTGSFRVLVFDRSTKELLTSPDRPLVISGTLPGVPAPTCTLSADVNPVVLGSTTGTYPGTSLLSWTTTYASSAVLWDGIAGHETNIQSYNGISNTSTAATGYARVSLTTGTTYSIKVTGPGGVATCTKTVSVTSTPTVPSLPSSWRPTEVQVVGMYEGTYPAGVMHSFGNHPTGSASVHVTGSPSSPAVLVLTSYEPVNWTVTVDSGSSLKKIIAVGYYDQAVVVNGSNQVPVELHSLSSDGVFHFAYTTSGSDYSSLSSWLSGMGYSITKFQGSYYGSNSTVTLGSVLGASTTLAMQIRELMAEIIGLQLQSGIH